MTGSKTSKPHTHENAKLLSGAALQTCRAASKVDTTAEHWSCSFCMGKAGAVILPGLRGITRQSEFKFECESSISIQAWPGIMMRTRAKKMSRSAAVSMPRDMSWSTYRCSHEAAWNCFHKTPMQTTPAVFHLHQEFRSEPWQTRHSCKYKCLAGAPSSPCSGL